jgi:hypothetical protein
VAVTGSITVSGSVAGLATGSKTLGPITITSAAPSDLTCGATTTVVLANGANTITVPSSTCTAAVIVFASASTTVKTLKGVSGDTGFTVTKNGTFVLQFDAAGAPANFVINSAGADTGNTTTIFWI